MVLKSDCQIKRENCRTPPNCGSNLPLISKICEYCGHNFDNIVEEMTSDELIAQVEQNLEKLNKISKPSFFRNLFAHYYILFPVLATYFLVLAIVAHTSSSGLIVKLFYFFTGVGIISIIVKIILVFFKKNKPGYDFYKAQYERYQNIARLYFGIVPKVDSLLNEFYVSVKKLEENTAKRKKSILTGYVLFIFLLIGSGISVDYIFNPSKKTGNDYFTEHYGVFYQNNFFIENRNFIGEFVEFAEAKRANFEVFYKLQRDLYESIDQPRINDISLSISKVPFRIKKRVDWFQKKDTTTILLIKAVIKDELGNKLADTLIADIRKWQFDLYNNPGSVFFADFKLESDTLDFSKQFIIKLKQEAKYVDLYSEFQLYDGPIRLK